jgi:TusA-related sulfurtransferase
MKVIDIREACCLISAGLDKQLKQLSPGEEVEVIISGDIGAEMLSDVAKREGCEIVQIESGGEIIRAVAKKRAG